MYQMLHVTFVDSQYLILILHVMTSVLLDHAIYGVMVLL